MKTVELPKEILEDIWKEFDDITIGWAVSIGYPTQPERDKYLERKTKREILLDMPNLTLQCPK